MRIVFLCGSLEEGKDGVGDYVSALSFELTKSGHFAGAIALNDKKINTVYSGNRSQSDVTSPILRLPFLLSNNDRISLAVEWVNNFNPDWLSLQFVPFSFDQKGLPFKLANQLQKIGVGRRWHIMFHELWLGIDREASLKLLCWGYVQRILIKAMVRKLSPLVIHTQSHVYEHQLKRNEIRVKYLPLFSNIPPISHFLELQKYLDAQHLTFVCFGAIHSGGNIRKFAQEVSEYGIENNKGIEFVFIGKSGTEYINWTKIFEEFDITVRHYGEQAPEVVSKILYSSNIGVSSTPQILSEKSGTIAAMLSHGLPVICVSHAWSPRHPTPSIQIKKVFEYSTGIIDLVLKAASTSSEVANASEVSEILARSLAEA